MNNTNNNNHKGNDNSSQNHVVGNEENNNNNSKTTFTSNLSSGNEKSPGPRPKPLYFWTNTDVSKWFKSHCSDIQMHYNHLFIQHDITGRSLIRMNDVNLEKLGVVNPDHRNEVLREILKLKLRGDIVELKEMENKRS